MSEVDFRTAIRQALDEEMAIDETVLVFGEDVAAAGGVWATTPKLQERYGWQKDKAEQEIRSFEHTLDKALNRSKAA